MNDFFILFLFGSLASFGLIFLLLNRYKPTSLFTAFSFGVFVLIATAIAFMYISLYSERLALILIMPIALLFVFFAAFWLFILIIGVIINTRTVLKHERASIANLLPAITLVTIFGVEITLLILNYYFKDNNFILFISAYVSACITYLTFIFILYAFTAVLYKMMPTFQKIDYILILGAGLNKDKVTPLLAGRVDAGIRFYLKQLRRKKHRAKIILCGGQGPDELISEAQAMKNYIEEKWGDDFPIYLEDRSTTTAENFQFAEHLAVNLDDIPHFKRGKVAIATSSYHLLRAGKIAQQQEVQAFGIGGKTKFYYIPTAFIREFIGYLSMKRRLHLVVFAILLLAVALPLLV